MPLQPGQLICEKRYKVVRVLGQGGYGAVYLVEDTRLSGRRVALKESFNNSPEATRQFELEATLLATIRHPSLPMVSDFFSDGSAHHFLVMEFVEGEDLSTIIQRELISERQGVQWMIEICEAVAFLHCHNPPIIHRDIKPHNIKIRADGRAVLVDFGIAKLYNPKIQTAAVARAISSGFSPPEQYGAGTHPYSDVYALGATLYCILTRRVPPEGLDLVMRKAQLPPPRQVNPATSPAVEQVILKAMALNSLARYPSAKELGEALRAALSGQSAPAPAPAAAGARCPRCGYINRPNARFCQKDGTPLAGGPAVPGAPVAPTPPPAAQAIPTVPPGMHFAMGNRHMQSKDFEAAVAEYQEAADGGFDEAALYLNWADACIELKRLDRAVDILQRAIVRYPHDGDLQVELGWAYALRGEDAKALQALQRAVRLNPQPSAHFLLALILEKVGQEGQAIDELEKFLADQPDSAVAHEKLGQLLIKAGRLSEAQGEFEKLLRLAPQSPEAHLYLAVVHQLAHHYPDAIRWAEKALSLAPGNAFAHIMIGDAQLEQKKFKEALKAFQQAAQCNSKDPDPHMKMAVCYAALKRRNDCRRELREVLRIDPTHQLAQELLAKI